MNQNDFVWATGRRKCAVARVRIKAGTGIITVDGKDWKDYFTTETLRGFILQPMVVVNGVGKYDIAVTFVGGGSVGQAGALRHGISRGLVKLDESLRPVLKAAGMMTRDARVKERKKSGQPGARKRFQFSKR